MPDSVDVRHQGGLADPVEDRVQAKASADLQGEVLRFLLVGGTAAMIDLVFYVLLTFAGAPVAIAKGLSFVVAGAAAYFGNKHFTYRRKSKGATSVILYGLLYTVTLGLNVLINAGVLAALQMPDAYEIGIAWTVATGASAMANFVGTKLLIFRGAHLS